MGRVGELLDRFCGEARCWGAATREGHRPVADRMSPLWSELAAAGAGHEIAALLDHPAVEVRYCAAARLHAIDWRRARAAMTPIADEPPPLGPLARRLLERWRDGDVEWRRTVLRFSGTVVAAEPSPHIAGRRWVTHYRCDYTVAIDVDAPPAGGPVVAGENLFAIHSVSRSFGLAVSEIVGRRMRFECPARERAGEWLLSDLRARPVR